MRESAPDGERLLKGYRGYHFQKGARSTYLSRPETIKFEIRRHRDGPRVFENDLVAHLPGLLLGQQANHDAERRRRHAGRVVLELAAALGLQHGGRGVRLRAIDPERPGETVSVDLSISRLAEAVGLPLEVVSDETSILVARIAR